MGKRVLSDEEKKASKKSLALLEEELEHLKFLYKHNQLMLDEGLESNYKEKRRAFAKNAKDLDGEAKFTEDKIGVLKEQLEKGVEVKEKKTPVGID